MQQYPPQYGAPQGQPYPPQQYQQQQYQQPYPPQYPPQPAPQVVIQNSMSATAIGGGYGRRKHQSVGVHIRSGALMAGAQRRDRGAGARPGRRVLNTRRTPEGGREVTLEHAQQNVPVQRAWFWYPVISLVLVGIELWSGGHRSAVWVLAAVGGIALAAYLGWASREYRAPPSRRSSGHRTVSWSPSGRRPRTAPAHRSGTGFRTRCSGPTRCGAGRLTGPRWTCSIRRVSPRGWSTACRSPCSR
ncbi:hypothetical protein MB27_31295 [Actinoplanes utahensis]|uniref:Uncharacterized protein n=1 Tax=Actinoplanes utahensis TaxID=1869 RepID=A0A0A6UFZ8_ACTUT|nr:hypothetical protein MB27_31295 [Actinoplanes utahensis]